MLKQNDVITYTALSYSNSETVGYVQGCTVFVPYMIVGETAQVKVNYVKRNVAYADVVRLVTPSPLRTVPACHRFGKCGGCSLMHMDYTEQLNFKRGKVVQNLLKIGKIDFGVLPCVPSPKVLGYRNKLSLPVRGACGNVQIGMYQRNSHKVVKTDNCLLSDSWCKILISEFTAYLNNARIAPYNEQNFTGEVRHLVARYIDGQLLVTVVSNGEFKRDLTPFANALAKRFAKFGLFVNVNTYKNNVILGKITRHVCGITHIESEHLGVKFRLQPDSFFQVNDGAKDLLYSKARELLDLSRTEALIDCFSGVGVLTNALASNKFEIYGIEIEPSAVEDANRLAELNGSNIVNICGDANAELPKLTERLRGKKISLVVDPPRKGLGEKVCRTILNADIDNIVYVSCNSATLARDLAALTSAYEITYVEPYDLFPQTDQVETLVHLSRRKPDGHFNAKV